ncbi:hypothetical protein LIP_0256 [Limnochorda pilosa]|uniref:2-hydroxyglutaryl-CoA dehydratase n=2 Tax=Limnochorda pilosa TaxID=1555112 RepID=A0A0K2SG81_LIMPI|nr:hypothetical protein LIP_0256 [Limnochorda pilosa]
MEPVFIWPHMGHTLDLMVHELFTQVGLERFLWLPGPVSEESIDLGNNRYTESCSPYACSTGSLKESLRSLLRHLEDDAERTGRPVEPRRIVCLMAGARGPCTFGWYAIVQERHLPQEFAHDLEKHGHTFEMTTLGLSGGAPDFLRQLARLGNPERLAGAVEYLDAWEHGLERLPVHQRLRARLRLALCVDRLLRPVRAKMEAAEAVRARSLAVRAHEQEPGATTRAYREGLALLRDAHGVAAIRGAREKALRLLDLVPRDGAIRPRIGVVGEIYIALTSFANRGAIENLLGRAGVEVVEGITLSSFLDGMLREARRRGWAKHPLLQPVLEILRKRNVNLLEERPRTPGARPFMLREVGGDGLPTVGHARELIEHEGVDGILHVYPFKCMPEGMAKDALNEMCNLYGVRLLTLSFDKETDIERLKTEIGTFSALLQMEVQRLGAPDRERFRRSKQAQVRWRQALGRLTTAMHDENRRRQHLG